MLLCSENTASTVDSTQNKMILCHLSANLCLKQRRKEERGCLQEQQVGVCEGTWPRAVRWALPHDPACATSSPGDMACLYCRSWSPPSPVMSTKEWIHGAKGIFHPSLPTPGKQSAAPGRSEGCPATGSGFVCLKEELWQKL